MAETIIDGTGSGHVAKIDTKNRLHTRAVSVSVSQDAAEEGDSYAIRSNMDTITVANGSVLWFRSDNPNKHFHVVDFIFNWNGGSTNFNRPCRVQVRIGSTVPSANNSEVPIITSNLTSNNVATATAYKWDGVGTGMTIATPGVTVLDSWVAQGRTIAPVGGRIILGRDDVLDIIPTPEEEGEFSCAIIGFYEDTD